MDINTSYEKFIETISNFEAFQKENISESDTRSKVIDKFFIEILGWDEIHIRREGHVNNGYFDYQFNIPSFNFIVEAKKNFKEFVIPENIPNSKKVKITLIYNQNTELIDQIRGYLVDVSLQYGVLTNGNQFIIGKFINDDGKPWKENYVMVFNGLEDIKNNYQLFYDNLSFEGVNKAKMISTFKITPKDSFHKTILSSLIDKNKEIVRNSLSVNLSKEIERIFGEIYSSSNEDNVNLIKECFIENKETQKNRAELNGLFDDLPPDLENIIPARNMDSMVNQIDEEIKNERITLRESPPKPIIIVGSKGAGKTTFINHLFKAKLKGDTLSHFPYVYIDLIKYFRTNENLDTTKIAKNIITEISEKYTEFNIYSREVLTRIYIDEIKNNDKGVWKLLKEENNIEYQKMLSSFFEEKLKNYEDHLDALSIYLIKERRKRLIIIIDNSDHYSDDIQKDAFLYITSLNKRAYCGVFISLREGYYYKWRNQPPFNAFESNVYHVTAPRYSEILQKRIDYTINNLDFVGNISGATDSKKFDLSLDRIKTFFQTVKESLFDNDNSKIIDFLYYTTFPNIREGLRLFKTFLVSGYTNVEEYILRSEFSRDERNLNTIPIHEFIKSIGLTNRLYYNREYSIIINLFNPEDDSNDHFIKLWILRILCKKLEEGGSSNKYYQKDVFVKELANYGYDIDLIHNALKFLIRFEFIETDNIISDVAWEDLPKNDFNISITSKGYYYINELISYFYYIDLVLQDTLIFNEEDYNTIKASFPLADDNGRRNLQKRLETAELFLDYLRKEEEKQSNALLEEYGSIVDFIYANGMTKEIERIKKVF